LFFERGWLCCEKCNGNETTPYWYTILQSSWVAVEEYAMNEEFDDYYSRRKN